jgi:hypothetical protein
MNPWWYGSISSQTAMSRGGAEEIYRHKVELLLKCSTTTPNGECVLVMDGVGARKEGTEAARVGK